MTTENYQKRILFLTVYPALLFILNACSSAGYVDILNGGFEEYSAADDKPYGWSANNFRHADQNAIFSFDKRTAHSGKRSVSIEIPRDAPSQNTIFNWVTAATNIKEGVYELTGWIKTLTVASSPYLEIQFYGGEGNRMITGYSTRGKYPLTGTNNWCKVNTSFKIPKGTTKTVIKAVLESYGNNGGKAWFDDIMLEKIGNN